MPLGAAECAKVIVGLVGGCAFLMKADWNNYSESKSLKQAIAENTATLIAMGFFAANMERKLRLLFVLECGWYLGYDFDFSELVIFPRFPDVPAIH